METHTALDTIREFSAVIKLLVRFIKEMENLAVRQGNTEMKNLCQTALKGVEYRISEMLKK